MIQGGDPVGNGSGGPGYKFLDEFDQSLLHDKSGVLSMANSGPGTNGSQFFITEVPTPHLDFKHSVFGQVVKGIEIQDEISNVKTAIANRPEKDIIIKKLTIIRKGSKAKKFDAVETWNEMEPKLLMIQQQKAQDEIDRISKGFTTTDSGLKYKINKPSDGANAKNGDKVRVHYAGKLTNGSEFDSSFKRNKPFEFIVGEGRVIKGWDEALKILKLGENATFVIPSNLGYGARGAGGVIPPNATLVFEIELLEILD
jgi:FKBP-type peptidyl-prolyl cis-trans isomerase